MYTIPIVGIIGQPEKKNDKKPYFGYTDVLMHINAAKEYEEIHLIINSIGGDVDEGKKIKQALQETGKTIYTSNSGDICSMAVSLFLLAQIENRSFDPDKGKFLIHNPWTEIQGDSQTLEVVSKELKIIENELAIEYAQSTGTDLKIISAFMDENKPLTQEQIESLGFATLTKQEFKAVAIYNINKNREKMSKENEALKAKLQEAQAKIEANEGVLAKLKAFFSGGGAKALLVQDSAGNELNFTDLEEGQTPDVGDKATVDGNAAEGDYVMTDGSTYVFASGELVEIKPAENDEEMAKLKEENESLKEQLEAANNKAEENATALAKLQDEGKKQAQEFESSLKELKASIKSLDVDLSKDKPRDDDGPTNKSPFKKK